MNSGYTGSPTGAQGPPGLYQRAAVDNLTHSRAFGSMMSNDSGTARVRAEEVTVDHIGTIVRGLVRLALNAGPDCSDTPNEPAVLLDIEVDGVRCVLER